MTLDEFYDGLAEIVVGIGTYLGISCMAFIVIFTFPVWGPIWLYEKAEARINRRRYAKYLSNLRKNDYKTLGAYD